MSYSPKAVGATLTEQLGIVAEMIKKSMSDRRLSLGPHREKTPRVKINWQAFEYYPALKRIKTYVREHPDGSLTLTEASDIAGMESTNFKPRTH